MSQWKTWMPKREFEALLRKHNGTVAYVAREVGRSESAVRHLASYYKIDVGAIRVESARRRTEESRKAEAERVKNLKPKELVDAELEVHRLRQREQQRERVWKEMAERADLTRSLRSTIVPYMEKLKLPAVQAPAIPKTDHQPITLQAVFNDLHWGKEFSANQLNNLNAYNPFIAARRVQHVVDVVGQYKENYENMGHPVEKLVVPLIGDMFNGELHPEDENNYASMMTQAIDCALVIGQAIWEMAHWFPEVVVISPAGDNHTRLTKKSATSAKAFGTTVNTMFMQCIALLLQQLPHVKVLIDTSHQTYYTLYGRTWGLCHGNMIKGGGGQLGIPAYGMRRHHDGSIAETVILAKREHRALNINEGMPLAERMKRMADLLEGIVDHTLVGHFHTRTVLEFTTGDLMICPSAMGPDPYARDALRRPGSMARQMLFAIHPKHDVMSEHVINLQQFVDEDCTSRYHWGVESNGGNMATMMNDWVSRQ